MSSSTLDVTQPTLDPVIDTPLDHEGAAGVGPGEVVRIALESLLANKTRALLTMLGVIIGVGSVVALMALGNGATAGITSQIQAIGTNVLTVIPGSAGGGNARGPGTDYLTYVFWDGSIKVRAGRLIDGAGHDVAATIETLEGTRRADVLRGSARVDDLRGGGGRDRIYGRGGNDILFVHGGTARGGAGSDYIQASGRSVALGGPESDEIALGAGPVRASGGPEPDSFRLISVRSTASRSR